MAGPNASKLGSEVTMQWDRFMCWAGEQIGIPKQNCGLQFYSSLTEIYPDESEALQRLADLCEEYQKTKEQFLR